MSGPSSLAKLLRTWRERAFLTQEQLARSTGLGVRTIRRLESGGPLRPRSDSLRLLADALELDDEERARLVAAARNGSPAPSAPPATVPRQPPAAVPRQLPADVAGFAGRTDHLHALDALLDGSASTVVISAIAGTAGVGKTALAVHWAHRVAERFPDGQLYVNLRGFDPSGVPVEPAVVLRGFLEALDVSPSRFPGEVDGLAGLFRSMLSGRRVLVVLDNARDAGQVRPLLPGARGCLAVVTSRNRLTGLVAAAGARPLTLDLLSTVEARELLAARVGAGAVAAEPEAVDDIVALCARLPLALAIVGARAATRRTSAPLAALAAELRAARTLDALDTGDALTDVRTVFSWSYRDLSAPAARLFRLLGLCPGPDISARAAASLAGVPVETVRPLLGELARAHLVAEPAPGRYAFHDLLHAYAIELADGERDTAIRRLLDHYLHTAYAADRVLNPTREAISLAAPAPATTPERIAGLDQALAWFTAEHPVLLATIHRAAGTGWDAHAWRLAWSLSTYLDRRGRWDDLLTTGEVAVAAAGRLGDVEAQRRTHINLSTAYLDVGRTDEAREHLHEACRLAAGAGDLVGEASARLMLAIVWSRQDRHVDALHEEERALALYRAAGDRRGQSYALNSMGWLHSVLGDHGQGLTYCREALALQEELDDRNALAETWDSLGYIHRHLGAYDEAIACYRRSLELRRHVGDRYQEATALLALAETHADAGDRETARSYRREALDILDELDHPDAEKLRANLAG